MSSRPFRFVHASDFHLERLPSGLAEVPDHLRELFIESAYVAAEKVFETVLSEEAEFLVLSGDILDSRQTGPRGPLFLVEQFNFRKSFAVLYFRQLNPFHLYKMTKPFSEFIHS